jgi:hypothetical protein
MQRTSTPCDRPAQRLLAGLLLLLSIGPGVSIAHSQTHNLHIESVFNGYVTGPGIDCGVELLAAALLPGNVAADVDWRIVGVK